MNPLFPSAVLGIAISLATTPLSAQQNPASPGTANNIAPQSAEYEQPASQDDPNTPLDEALLQAQRLRYAQQRNFTFRQQRAQDENAARQSRLSYTFQGQTPGSFSQPTVTPNYYNTPNTAYYSYYGPPGPFYNFRYYSPGYYPGRYYSPYSLYSPYRAWYYGAPGFRFR